MKRHPYLQMTLKLLRKSGWVDMDIVERRIQHPGHPESDFRPTTVKDYLGVIDVIAFGGGKTLGAQATGAGGRGSHRRKIVSSIRALNWIKNGNELWLVTWKRKEVPTKSKTAKSASKLVWVPTVDTFEEKDFVISESVAPDESWKHGLIKCGEEEE